MKQMIGTALIVMLVVILTMSIFKTNKITCQKKGDTNTKLVISFNNKNVARTMTIVFTLSSEENAETIYTDVKKQEMFKNMEIKLYGNVVTLTASQDEIMNQLSTDNLSKNNIIDVLTAQEYVCK